MLGRGSINGLNRGSATQTRKSDWEPRKEVARKMKLGSWRHLAALVVRTQDSVLVYGNKAVADKILATSKLPVEGGKFVEGIVDVTHLGWDNVPVGVLQKRIQHIKGHRFDVKGAVGVISN